MIYNEVEMALQYQSTRKAILILASAIDELNERLSQLPSTTLEYKK